MRVLIKKGRKKEELGFAKKNKGLRYFDRRREERGREKEKEKIDGDRDEHQELFGGF